MLSNRICELFRFWFGIICLYTEIALTDIHEGRGPDVHRWVCNSSYFTGNQSRMRPFKSCGSHPFNPIGRLITGIVKIFEMKRNWNLYNSSDSPPMWSKSVWNTFYNAIKLNVKYFCSIGVLNFVISVSNKIKWKYCLKNEELLDIMKTI